MGEGEDEMTNSYEKPLRQLSDMHRQWVRQPSPPVGLLEERVLELESLGLLDEEDVPGAMSGVRQFAITTLQHHKPPYFVTFDNQLLEFRDVLEARYGLPIFSIREAIMLLRDIDGPPN
jgi:hypothetical protein